MSDDAFDAMIAGGEEDAPPILCGWMDGRRVLAIDFAEMLPGVTVAFERHDPVTHPDGRYLTVSITKPAPEPKEAPDV